MVKLGKTAYKASEVIAKAFLIFAATESDISLFLREFMKYLETGGGDKCKEIINELCEQDWKGVILDIGLVLQNSSGSLTSFSK